MATSPLPPAAATLNPEDIRAEFDLPSGKHVVIRKGKGRDLRLALMSAGPKADPYRILFALVSQLSLIDGKRVPVEALDNFDLDDAQALLTEAGAALGPLGRISHLQTVETQETAQDGDQQPS